MELDLKVVTSLILCYTLLFVFLISFAIDTGGVGDNQQLNSIMNNIPSSEMLSFDNWFDFQNYFYIDKTVNPWNFEFFQGSLQSNPHTATSQKFANQLLCRSVSEGLFWNIPVLTGFGTSVCDVAVDLGVVSFINNATDTLWYITVTTLGCVSILILFILNILIWSIQIIVFLASFVFWVIGIFSWIGGASFINPIIKFFLIVPPTVMFAYLLYQIGRFFIP